MDCRVKAFLEGLKNKKIALIGIGRSNLPLVSLFTRYGARVTVCDRKRESEVEPQDLKQILDAGAQVCLGEDYLDKLDAEIVFRTPGMYFNNEKLQSLIKKGIVVTSEMEVFFKLCPARIYAVTGSDGKTTTTSVIAKMLETQGKKVYLGGNIGVALLPRIEEITADDYAVVELSSFQLISMRQSPDVAVITNVAPNHLDVHGTMKEYVESKLNLIVHQDGFSKTVLNADNQITNDMSSLVRSNLCYFSRTRTDLNGAYCDENGDIYINKNGEKTFVMNKTDIRLPGEHNVENYICACSAVSDEVSVENMKKVAREFGGVEHRIEFVRELDGVKYYNDSIATSPTRTIAGLKAFGKKIIVIAGGYDKKIPYEPLGPYINEFVHTLILMGATAKKIEQAVVEADNFAQNNIKILHAEDMAQAVSLARENACEGDVVSLSPASAGFDKYKDFEARGRHFKQIVKDLK